MVKNSPTGNGQLSPNFEAPLPHPSGGPPFNPSDVPPDGACFWNPYAGMACARGEPANIMAAKVGDGASSAWRLAGWGALFLAVSAGVVYVASEWETDRR